MGEALLDQQRALLAALGLSRHEDAIASLAPGAHIDATCSLWQRGLLAYRSNAHELAGRALAGAYPVVAQLLGEENFRALARGLWQHDRPQRGDVAQWGEMLAPYIESLADLARQEPYLADVARAEWLLHKAATAADGVQDAASFSLLAERDPAEFTLVLGPGTACAASPYPVVSIINAHVEGEPTLDEAGERLRAGAAETALVWRQGMKPRLREAAQDEAAFITALQEKRSLADSLEAAPRLDFNQWLGTAVQTGLLLAAAPL